MARRGNRPDHIFRPYPDVCAHRASGFATGVSDPRRIKPNASSGQPDRVLLAFVGLWMIVSTLRPHSHAHLAGRSVAFGFFAGLVPCPLTLFVVTFAASRGVIEAGLAFALVMLVGVAAVLVSVALVANLSRGGLARLMNNKLMSIVASGLQVATGVILLIAAWRML